MPLYPFRCDSCGARDDRFMTLAAHATHGKRQRCRECEGRMTQQVVPVAIQGTYSGFWQNRGDGFGRDERTRRAAYAAARKQGINPVGKTFVPQLCPEGKPFAAEAWVNGPDDVKRVCEENGWGCEGKVNVKPRFGEKEPARPFVARDIIERAAESEIGEQTVTAREYADAVDRMQARIQPETPAE
jgi:predicted nucleic acid-binding Zn ribbon protein